MWNGLRVSVALPTYNEQESIRACVEGFFATGVVDEVIVCNNNAAPGTSEAILGTGAREVFESRQGYGWSCRTALAATTGDLVVLAEPDGSFEPRDILKLLAYSQDFDVVLGSRTNRELIWTGANMGWFMKWGNWAVAKYMEFAFNTTSLTDSGCTMRLLSRPVLDRVWPHFSVGTSHFGPEMMMLCIWSGARVMEIPLNYKQRVGQSSVTGNRWVAYWLGVRMAWLISVFRLKTWAGLGPSMARGGFDRSGARDRPFLETQVAEPGPPSHRGRGIGRATAWWVGLFALGFVLRLVGLPFNGMPDLDTMVLVWGAQVHAVGLAETPLIIYGLLSYVFHHWAFDLAMVAPRFWWAPQKLFQVGFEVAIFWTLVRLLPPTFRWTAMFAYWLNPWFVLHGGWQGFWDGPHTLSALMAVLVLRALNSERLGWAAAGACLATGALFKPQGLLYFVVPVGLYLFWQAVTQRRLTPLVSFSLGLSTIFGAAIGGMVIVGGDALAVPRNYLIGEVWPNLCNGCIGIWRPVSQVFMVLLGQTGATWDLRLPEPFGSLLDRVVLGSTMLLIAVFALVVSLQAARSERWQGARGVLAPVSRFFRRLSPDEALRPAAPYVAMYLVATFAALVIPQLGTRAHINHAYAGIVLLTPLAMLARPIFWPWLTMLVVQAYGHLSIYTFGPSTPYPNPKLGTYPHSRAEVLDRIDPASYEELLAFQSHSTRLIETVLPAYPMVSFLSVFQFAALLVVIWQLFFRFRPLAALVAGGFRAGS